MKSNLSNIITKECSNCLLVKSIDDFHLIKDNRRKNDISHFYYKNICKFCENIYVNSFKKSKRKLNKFKNNELHINNNKQEILIKYKNYTQFHNYINQDELLSLFCLYNEGLFKKLKRFEKAVYNHEYQKTYREANKEKISEKNAKRYKDNKIEFKIRNKEYRENHKEFLKLKRKQYKTNNRELFRERYNNYQRKRYHEDELYRLRQRISWNIRKTLLTNNSNKNKKSILEFLPFSIKELKACFELMFDDWMNWNNYGSYKVSEWNDDDKMTWKWNIDHIIPQANLPYDSMEHFNFKKCWALENLRPYSAKQNMIDSNLRGCYG